MVDPTCGITDCIPSGQPGLLERLSKRGGQKLKQMEERDNAGEMGNPKEHVWGQWGKEKRTGKYRKEEGNAA